MANEPSVLTQTTTIVATNQDLLAAAAVRMYNAEGTLHLAHQAHIDAWVVAAYTQLHNAIADHTACLRHIAA